MSTDLCESDPKGGPYTGWRLRDVHLGVAATLNWGNWTIETESPPFVKARGVCSEFYGTASACICFLLRHRVIVLAQNVLVLYLDYRDRYYLSCCNVCHFPRLLLCLTGCDAAGWNGPRKSLVSNTVFLVWNKLSCIPLANPDPTEPARRVEWRCCVCVRACMRACSQNISTRTRQRHTLYSSKLRALPC